MRTEAVNPHHSQMLGMTAFYPVLTGSKNPILRFERETRKLDGGQLPIKVRLF